MIQSCNNNNNNNNALSIIFESHFYILLHVKSWLIGKDSDAGRDGARGEGGDRGWDGWMASLTWWTWVSVNSGSWQCKQGGLVCCDSWCRRESDTTEWLIWSDLIWIYMKGWESEKMEKRKDNSRYWKRACDWNIQGVIFLADEFRLHPLSTGETVKGSEEWWSKTKHIFWKDNFGGRMEDDLEKEETTNSLGCYCKCAHQVEGSDGGM